MSLWRRITPYTTLPLLIVLSPYSNLSNLPPGILSGGPPVDRIVFFHRIFSLPPMIMVPGRETPPPLRVVPKGSADYRFSCLSKIDDSRSKGISQFKSSKNWFKILILSYWNFQKLKINKTWIIKLYFRELFFLDFLSYFLILLVIMIYFVINI